MIKLKPREKILFYMTVAFALAWLFQKYLFYDVAAEIKTLHQKTIAEELRLKTGLTIQARKEAILKDRDDYGGYLKEENISSADSATNFLKEIERIAQESKVSIISLSPSSAPAGSGGYTKCGAELRLEGAQGQIYLFLGKIQESRSLIKIDKLSLSPKDEQAKTLRLEASLSLAAS